MQVSSKVKMKRKTKRYLLVCITAARGKSLKNLRVKANAKKMIQVSQAQSPQMKPIQIQADWNHLQAWSPVISRDRKKSKRLMRK